MHVLAQATIETGIKTTRKVSNKVEMRQYFSQPCRSIGLMTGRSITSVIPVLELITVSLRVEAVTLKAIWKCTEVRMEATKMEITKKRSVLHVQNRRDFRGQITADILSTVNKTINLKTQFAYRTQGLITKRL